MSNSRSIAAVTHALRYLLDERFRERAERPVAVTTKPLDKARDASNGGGDQVNLFYIIIVRMGPGETCRFPVRSGPGKWVCPLWR